MDDNAFDFEMGSESQLEKENLGKSIPLVHFIVSPKIEVKIEEPQWNGLEHKLDDTLNEIITNVSIETEEESEDPATSPIPEQKESCMVDQNETDGTVTLSQFVFENEQHHKWKSSSNEEINELLAQNSADNSRVNKEKKQPSCIETPTQLNTNHNGLPSMKNETPKTDSFQHCDSERVKSTCSDYTHSLNLEEQLVKEKSPPTLDKTAINMVPESNLLLKDLRCSGRSLSPKKCLKRRISIIGGQNEVDGVKKKRAQTDISVQLDTNHNGLSVAKNEAFRFFQHSESERVQSSYSECAFSANFKEELVKRKVISPLKRAKTICNMASKLSLDLGNFRCSNCAFSSSCKRILKRHIRRDHGEKVLDSISAAVKKGEHDFNSSLRYSKSDFVSDINKDIKERLLAAHIVEKKEKNLTENDVYKCSLCDYVCSSESNLKEHELHHDTKGYKCAMCDFGTKYRSALRRHELVHLKIEALKKDSKTIRKLLKCEKCGFSTRLKRNLIFHRLRHSRLDPNKNSESTNSPCCTENQREKNPFHRKRSNSECKRYSCSKCNLVFKYNILQKHMLTKHKDVGTSQHSMKPQVVSSHNQITSATNSFRQRENARTIIEAKKPMNSFLKSVNYYCSECTFVSESVFDIKNHVTKQHFPSEKNVSVEMYYYVSINLKSTDNIPPFHCSFCSYESKWKGNLRQHEKKHHTGINSSNLQPERKDGDGSIEVNYKVNNNLETAADNSAVPVFHCSFCAYTSKWRGNVQKHEKKHHTGINSSNPEKTDGDGSNKLYYKASNNCEGIDKSSVFHCLFCVYTSKWSSNVCRHIKQHHKHVDLSHFTPQRKKRKRKRNGSIELKATNGSGVFHCSFCVYTSKWKSNIQKHEKNQHACINSSHLEPSNKHEVVIDNGALLHCSFCSYTSKWKGNIQQHEKKRHSLVNSSQVASTPNEVSYTSKKDDPEEIGEESSSCISPNSSLKVVQPPFEDDSNEKLNLFATKTFENNSPSSSKTVIKSTPKLLHRRSALKRRLAPPIDSKLEASVDNSTLFHCSLCPYKSVWKGNLRLHEKKYHTGISTSNLQPKKTDGDGPIKVNYKANNNNLETAADNSAVFHCSFCAYTSKWRGNVQKHEKKHHTGINSSNFQPERKDGDESTEMYNKVNNNFEAVDDDRAVFHCSFCAYTSKWNGNLQKHVKKHHSHVMNSSNFQPEKKDGDEFTEMYNKVNNIEAVDDDRAVFHCSFCVYTSKWKGHVRRHERKLHSSVNSSNLQLEKTDGDEPIEVNYKVNNNLETAADNSAVFHCSLCAYTSKWRGNLRLHEKKHHTGINSSNFQPEKKDGDEFTEMYNKVNNIEAVDDDRAVFHCSFCVYTSKWKGHIRRHERTQHTNVNSSNLHLEKTDGDRPIEMNYKVNNPETAADNSAVFHCSFCAYTSKWRGNVQKHEKKHHSHVMNSSLVASNSNGVACTSIKENLKVITEEPSCMSPKSCINVVKPPFDDHSNQKIETTAETVENNKPPLSETVVESTPNSQELNLELPEEITDCRKESSTSDNSPENSEKDLTRATRRRKSTEEEQQNSKPNLEKLSDNEFSSETLLKDGLNKTISRSQVFKCPDCAYQTNVSKYLLEIHRKIHLKVKMLQCPQCPFYKTNLARNLKQHQLTHLKVKRFRCNQCEYRTNYRVQLKTHMQRKHFRS